MIIIQHPVLGSAVLQYRLSVLKPVRGRHAPRSVQAPVEYSTPTVGHTLASLLARIAQNRTTEMETTELFKSSGLQTNFKQLIGIDSTIHF